MVDTTALNFCFETCFAMKLVDDEIDDDDDDQYFCRQMHLLIISTAILRYLNK